VPNGLGDPAQIGPLVTHPTDGQVDVADAQGVGRTVWLIDPDPSTPLGRQDDVSQATACFHAPVALGAPAVPNYQSFTTGSCTADDPSMEDLCCEPIMHLCNVPRCPYEGCDPGVVSSPREGHGQTEQFIYTNSCGEVISKEVYVPECVPFYMPSACCERLWNGAGPPAPITTPFMTDCD
jgi:hypothetical protein